MWKIEWLEEARNDLHNLDGGTRKQVLKAILTLEQDPIGYGEPLGKKNNLNLTPIYKIQPCHGIRAVYLVTNTEVTVLIVSVGKREQMKVYETAAQRMTAYRKETEGELRKLQKIAAKIDKK